MPCMGPTPPTDAEAKEITKAVLEYLASKHKLLNWPAEELMFDGLVNAREKAIIMLEAAIKEVIWQDRCETF